MKLLSAMIALVLFCAAEVSAADGELQFAEFERCRLENGEFLSDCRIGYRTYGTLNENRSNAVLFPSWFTGTSEDHATYEFIGPDKTVDSSRYFVISVGALSNGVSSSPSDDPDDGVNNFPDITIGDMVESQYRLLTEVLDISHLHAIVGISMGGMQAFDWVVRYPEFMDKAVPITGTPKQTSYDILLWDTERITIETLGDSEEAVRIISGIDQLVAYTPDYVVANDAPDESANSQEDAAGADREPRLRVRLPQLKAMIAHDVTRAFDGDLAATTKSVQAEMLIVVSPTDHVVNPNPSREFAESLGARLVEFDGSCGHVDSVCGRDWLAPVVREFLSSRD